MSTCTAEECARPEHAQGLCVAHYRRKRRGAGVDAPLRPYRKPWTTAFEAALALDVDSTADADSDFERAKDRFRKAMVAYVRSLGYRKP